MGQGRFKCPSASPVTAFALGPTPREKVEGAHDAHGLHIPRLRICGEIELRHGVGAEVEAGQQGGPDPSPRHRDDRPGAGVGLEAALEGRREAQAAVGLERAELVQDHVVGGAGQAGDGLGAGPAEHRLVKHERPDDDGGTAGGGGGGARCAVFRYISAAVPDSFRFALEAKGNCRVESPDSESSSVCSDTGFDLRRSAIAALSSSLISFSCRVLTSSVVRLFTWRMPAASTTDRTPATLSGK